MKKNFKQIFSILLTLLIPLSFSSCQQKSNLEKTTLTIQRANDKSTIDVIAEIADTLETRNHGFMERKNIPDGTGMIFVFEYDQILSFWMKNTPHPLSIAYIDSKGRIRDIFDMEPYDLSSVSSSGSVRYALEVPQGWFKANDINVGDKLISK